MNYILINSKCRNAAKGETIMKVKSYFKESLAYDLVAMDFEAFYNNLESQDQVVIVGGDGTLNHFINDIENKELKCKYYFYSNGTGNDFFNDVKDKLECKNHLIYVNDIIKNLPIVRVKGKEYRFVNGIGYGIDGYCCEKADELHAKSDKPVNYTSIALKGLLFHYKRPNAKVTVDGVTREYKKVWLAPVMKGRFYGGGMMIAPNQDRFDESHTLTSVVLHNASKLKLIFNFKKIFKGTHINLKKIIDIRCGHKFNVEFDKPTALQIDGETVKDVLEFEVEA